jgi:hypothetical protein
MNTEILQERGESLQKQEGFISPVLDSLTFKKVVENDGVKIVMNTKLALQILTYLTGSRKVGVPFNLKQVWYSVFTNERMPTDNFHNIPAEQSISYEELRERLLNAAISYLAEKIDK